MGGIASIDRLVYDGIRSGANRESSAVVAAERPETEMQSLRQMKDLSIDDSD